MREATFLTSPVSQPKGASARTYLGEVATFEASRGLGGGISKDFKDVLEKIFGKKRIEGFSRASLNQTESARILERMSVGRSSWGGGNPRGKKKPGRPTVGPHVCRNYYGTMQTWDPV